MGMRNCFGGKGLVERHLIVNISDKFIHIQLKNSILILKTISFLGKLVE